MAERSRRSTLYWPEDLLYQILPRLPVKSILRFKCASKTWCSLFEHSRFVSQHLKTINQKNKNHLLIVQSKYLERSMRLFHDQTLVPNYQDLAPQIPPCLKHVGYPLRLCVHDGLLCVSVQLDNSITLWNPATREFRLLPKCPENIPPMKLYHRCFFGFGLDSLSNDYKVIQVYDFRKTFSDPVTPYHHVQAGGFWDWDSETVTRYHLSVYSMSTNSWRALKLGKDVVEAVDYMSFDDNTSNACANGFYYWVAGGSSTRNFLIRKVLAFHFSTEVFQLIDWPTPKSTRGELLRLPDDRISLCTFDFQGTAINNDVWMLNTDPKRQRYSWTRLLRIGHLPGVQRVLGFWNNDRVVFVESAGTGQVLVYNLDTKEFSNVGTNTNEVCHLVGAHTYAETLVAVSHRK